MTALAPPPPTTTEPDVAPEEPASPHPDQPRPFRRRTTDDVLSAGGSALASLAFVWLLYEKVFAWSGVVGFVVCWWLVYLGLYACVSAIGNPRPVVVERVASAVLHSSAVLVGGALLSVVVLVFVRGAAALRHLNFFTEDMAGVRPTDPLTKGGCVHAIVGSAIQIGLATLISLPLGVATAVYMTEVGGRFARTVRTVVEAMTGLPDILAGLFIYTVLIIGLNWERTGFTVSLALSVTMIPIVARATEVVLRVVPGGLREASVALGASQWRTVRRVVVPTARSGVATALILGIARIAGETAPLLIVSAATPFFNANPFQGPMNSLPLYIFLSIRSGVPNDVTRGYGAASILLMLAIVLFLLTRCLARDKIRMR
jgi:phosphate transport system permease protein